MNRNNRVYSRVFQGVVGCLLASIAACSTVEKVSTLQNEPKEKQIQSGSSEVQNKPNRKNSTEGLASWYGRKHQHRRTASGERFNMFELTAAHRTLPFGSKVKVRNLSTGNEVVVRVNDRGPWSRGRLIDVSYAAGRALGILRTGIAPVKIETL